MERFFQFLGLRQTVTFDEYISFCKQISENKIKDIGSASNVLIDYLFSDKGKEWHSSYYLSLIGDICFVKVANLKYFSWIKAPCQPLQEYLQLGIGLTKLNQSVVFNHASLVWTVKPVVKLPQPSQLHELQLSQQDYLKILEELGVTTSPKSSDVYQNLLNISNTNLSNFNLFSTYNQKEYTDETMQACPTDVIRDNILYLQNNNGKDLLKMLQEVPCIPVCAESSLDTRPKKTVLVKSIEVVRQILPADEKLVPYVNLKPFSLNQIDEALKLMGVCDCVGLKHIQHMLQKLQNQCKATTLGPNEIEKVRHAVLKLGQLLQNSKKPDDISQELTPLFLPSPTGYDWHLINSTELVFIDSTRYNSEQFNFVAAPYSLFQIPPDTRPKYDYEHRFRSRPLLSTSYKDTSHYERFSLPEMTEKDFCLRLPKKIRPKGMSLCCYEKVVLLHVEDTDSSLSLHIQNLKTLLEHLEIIFPDIVSYHSIDLPDRLVKTFFSNLVEMINNLRVIVVPDLKAGVFSDAELTNRIATISPDFVLQGENSVYTLYVAKKATASSVTVMTELSRSLCITMAKISQYEGTTFLKLIPAVRVCIQQQCDEDIQSLCKEFKIKLQHEHTREKKEEGSFLPKLGHSIPKEFHHMLDTDINHIFRPQEWVGYEEAEENFVWAIVLYPVQEQNGATSSSLEPIMKKYLIQYNEKDDEGKVVPAVDLYKFITIHVVTDHEGGQELVLVNDASSSTVITQPCDDQRMKEMKRKICRELLLLWKLPDDEKKKAIRRMYIKYHPDKAKPAERDLYEDAFKFMLRQINRLENGLQIEDPDEEVTPDIEEIHQTSSWTQHYRQWNMYVPKHSWSRGHRSSRAGGTSGGHSNFHSFQPQTSPAEAERWLRQARSDYEVMQLLQRISPSSASCQIIFLAHEVIEKALKAGMYRLVGLNANSLVNHELYCHAQAISSQRQWTEPSISLTEIAFNMSPYYLNSRYPNKHPLPKAPVDVYERNEAHKAALYAEMVINFIDNL